MKIEENVKTRKILWQGLVVQRSVRQRDFTVVQSSDFVVQRDLVVQRSDFVVQRSQSDFLVQSSPSDFVLQRSRTEHWPKTHLPPPPPPPMGVPGGTLKLHL